jgi:hypothetical protein
MADNSSSVASQLASMVGVNTASGTVANPTNSGRQGAPGSGVKVGAPAGTGGMQRSLAGPAGAQARGPKPPAPKAPKAPQAQQPKFSAHNPPLGTPMPAAPHPGLAPPYPDARSPQPTMMPNGLMVMPPPTGFIGAGMPPRVPKTFIPGMSGLLGR